MKTLNNQISQNKNLKEDKDYIESEMREWQKRCEQAEWELRN